MVGVPAAACAVFDHYRLLVVCSAVAGFHPTHSSRRSAKHDRKLVIEVLWSGLKFAARPKVQSSGGFPAVGTSTLVAVDVFGRRHNSSAL
jgi:hypothetical protein